MDNFVEYAAMTLFNRKNVNVKRSVAVNVKNLLKITVKIFVCFA